MNHIRISETAMYDGETQYTDKNGYLFWKESHMPVYENDPNYLNTYQKIISRLKKNNNTFPPSDTKCDLSPTNFECKSTK